MARALGLAFIALITFSCNSGGMPLERPQDFQVQLLDGGGMSPESETLVFGPDSSYYESWYDQARNHIPMPVTPADLDSLYGLLRSNGAMSIVCQEEGQVFDRGGTTVTISFGNNSHQITNAGSSFISPRHVKQYEAIVKGLWDHAGKHLRKMKREVPITVVHHADSIPMDFFNLSVDGQPVHNWEATKDEPFSEIQAQARCIPGNHQVDAWAKVNGNQISQNKAVRLAGPETPLTIHIWPDSITFH